MPWSSPSRCQLPWEPCGQGITAISVTTSELRPCQGAPLTKGVPRAGGWGRAGAALGHLLCRAPVLQLPGAADICQQWVMHRAATPQEGAKGSPSHGHTGDGRALTPHPGAGLTASPGHPGAAERQSPSAPTATGPRLCGGTRGEHHGSAGMGQGLPWKPRVLSWRGKEQRPVQSPAPHPDRGADCPQPQLHTLSQHSPTRR